MKPSTRVGAPPAEVAPAETGQAKSITNALRALLILADARRPLGVTEVATAIGLHKSSASRILATLRTEKFVDREGESGRYQLGLGILSLAGVVLSKYRLPASARQALELLAEQSGETVTVSGWNGSEAVNIDQILGSRSISHYSPPGRVNPAHCTATGKVFLAHCEPAAVAQVLGRPLTRYTRKTIVSVRAMRKELATVRRQGYAIADCEFLDDVVSIATPVFDHNGGVAYAIAVTFPSFRHGLQHQQALSSRLLDVARDLSVRSGFNPSSGALHAHR